MRPRLASLALLLLALCSTASSLEVVITSWTSVSPPVERATIVTTKTKETVVKKAISSKLTPDKIKELDGIMGNTLFAIVLKSAGKFDALPDFYKKAINNGIRCEFDTADFENKIKKAQYGLEAADKLSEDQHGAEETALNADAELKKLINCAVTPKNDCFCDKKKALLYCLADAMKPSSGTACRPAAIEALKTKGSGKIGKVYAGELKPPGKDVGSDADAADMFCDTLDDTVEAAIKDLYAADALYWTAETIELAALEAEFGIKDTQNSDDEFKVLCANADFKASKVGECLCGLEKGFVFCFIKGLANLVKGIGALDCKLKTIDKTKQLTAQQMASLLGAKIPDAPGAPGAPGASGAAATSSLLLLPLSVAAAMLLRH